MQSLMVFLSNHRHLFMFNVLHAAKSTSKSLVCLRNTLALYEHRFTRTSFIKTLNIHTGYSMSKSDEAAYLVSVKDAKNFVERSMVAVGTKKEHARALADVLILADQRGHYSHGLNRLEKYIQEIKSGSAIADNEPFIATETVSTALVDGNNALGCVVGNYAMAQAIKKAQETGVGWVVARNSNHYGIAGMYSLQAVEQGLMGFSFTNTSPFLVPTRSKQRFLGTNPISAAAPSENPEDPFVLDMATTAVAQGKIEVAHRKDHSVPEGWGTDAAGAACTDPGRILDEGGLMPVGGEEITGGYKGYGLAMMVEVLCGITAGAKYATNIRTWNTVDLESGGYPNLGQCFIAVDPKVFAPGFESRLSDLMEMARKLKPAEEQQEVLVAGDPERKSMEKVEEDGGITYHPNFIKYLDELAKSCGVEQIGRKMVC